MSQKKVLGRGLGALIPQKEQAKAAPQPVPATNEIAIDQIVPNPYQPRKTFDDKAIEELANSIREHGIMQPILVTRKDGKYHLIAGERRFRAAQKVGLKTVPVVVRDVAGANALELALIENIQRQDLNPLEEANAYQQLHDEFAMTQEEIAKRVGKERSTVANFLRLLKLPEKIRQLVGSGQLSMGHARALLSVSDSKKQQAIADRAVKEGLSVRQVEQLATSEAEPAAPALKIEKPKDVFTRDAEEKLARILRTRVEINRKKRGGSITIQYSNEEELIRLFEDISGRHR